VAKKGGEIHFELVHGTVDMTKQCYLKDSSISVIDSYMHLNGELLSKAHRISSEE
jgi:hypothetical protein